MGAGKSTIAGALASRLGVCAVDSDAEVVRLDGRSIPEIFARDGEAAFRELEVRAVEGLLADAQRQVVALGGGAFITGAVRDACRRHDAITIYLHAAPDALLERLSPDGIAARPLLGNDPAGALAALYARRDPLYRLACHTVETAGLAIPQVVDAIAELVAVDSRESDA